MTSTDPTRAGDGRGGGPRLGQTILAAFISGPGRILLVLLLIVAFFCAMRFEVFASLANLRNITMAASILLVMAVGATFVLVTGGVDLSVGSVLVFSGVIAAMVMEALGGQGWTVSGTGLVAALIAGAAWGLLNGVLIAKGQVPPLVVTLGTFGAAQGLSWIIAGEDLRSVPYVLGDTIGVGSSFGIPNLVIVALLCVLFGAFLLGKTGFGRHTMAVGSNLLAAREMGINVDRHLIKVYTLAGALAGLAGLLSLARYGSTTIGGHTTDNLQVIAAVVIGGTSLFGGRGSVLATAVGVLIPATLASGLIIIGLNTFWRDVMVGVVLIGAVYLDQVGRRRNR